MALNRSVAVAILMLLASEAFGQSSSSSTGDYLGQPPPGATPRVFARGVVSTDDQEHSAPAFSPGGDEVLWQVNRRPAPGERICQTMTARRVDGRWTEPALAPFGLAPVFSPDASRLYFEKAEPTCDGAVDGPYVVERRGDGWSEPLNLGLVERFPDLRFTYQLSVTRDGTLYFLGYAEGQQGDFGIYRAERVDDAYSKPELLPPSINVPGEVLTWTPWIAPDESYLLFSSNRAPSADPYGDLFVAFRRSDDSWTKPVSLGEPINSNRQERFPAVSPDGRFLFFTRDTPEHEDDVFWVSASIIDSLRARHLPPRQ